MADIDKDDADDGGSLLEQTELDGGGDQVRSPMLVSLTSWTGRPAQFVDPGQR